MSLRRVALIGLGLALGFVSPAQGQITLYDESVSGDAPATAPGAVTLGDLPPGVADVKGSILIPSSGDFTDYYAFNLTASRVSDVSITIASFGAGFLNIGLRDANDNHIALDAFIGNQDLPIWTSVSPIGPGSYFMRIDGNSDRKDYTVTFDTAGPSTAACVSASGPTCNGTCPMGFSCEINAGPESECLCQISSCGDGAPQPSPRCVGGDNNGAPCFEPAECLGNFICGEECDDGNSDATDGCLPNCEECAQAGQSAESFGGINGNCCAGLENSGGNCVVPGSTTTLELQVTYSTPVQDYGPLSFGLAALPSTVDFSMVFEGIGTSPSVVGQADVQSASITFGDFTGTEADLTSFVMTIDGAGTVDQLTWRMGPGLITGTVLEIMTANSNETLTIRGTDISSGDEMQYRYEDRSESIAPASSVPLPPWMSFALGAGVLLVGWRVARARSTTASGSRWRREGVL